MNLIRPFLFIAPLMLSFAAHGCAGDVDANEAAASCGKQECPAGTAQVERRSVTGKTDVSAGYDPATYAADGAFASFGSGQCEFYCQVISACPETTFPVITKECFTCGVVLANDTVDRVSCE